LGAPAARIAITYIDRDATGIRFAVEFEGFVTAGIREIQEEQFTGRLLFRFERPSERMPAGEVLLFIAAKFRRSVG